MKNRFFVLGMTILILSLSLGFVSCGDDGGSGGGDEYLVQWGTTNISYSTIVNTISTQGWTIAETDNTSWSLATGTTATAIYNYCMNPSNITWTNYGNYDGSFEVCVNKSISGVSAPSGLKTAANNHKNDVPLAGVYYHASAGVVLLYFTKK